MTPKYDPQIYGRLLADVLPTVIRSEAENERAITFAGALMRKKRSPEEERLLDLLVSLIEQYEERSYPMPHTSDPVLALRLLMDEHRLKQGDVLDIFGSQGVVSQVLNGKREISKSQAKKLSERFGLPLEIFI